MSGKIPRTLDRPTRCLGMPIDAIVVALGVYSLFVLLELGAVGVAMALITSNIFARYRSQTFFRNFLRFCYWYLPKELSSIQGVQGHVRELYIRSSDLNCNYYNDKYFNGKNDGTH